MGTKGMAATRAGKALPRTMRLTDVPVRRMRGLDIAHGDRRAETRPKAA